MQLIPRGREGDVVKFVEFQQTAFQQLNKVNNVPLLPLKHLR